MNVYQANSTPRSGKYNRSSSAGSGVEKYLTPQVITLWITFIAMVTCNALFETLRFAGTTSAEVTFQVFAWFTPAGYAFSIWTLIYLALAAWLVTYTRDAPMREAKFGRVEVLFIATSALNVLWLAVFHLQMVGLALLVIAVLLVAMIALYRAVSAQGGMMGRIAFSIYTAWLTVATIVNATNLLTRMTDGGIPIANEVSVPVIAAVVLAIGVFAYRKTGDIAFPLVFLWALVAVGVNVWQASIPVAVITFIVCGVGFAATFLPVVMSRLAPVSRRSRAAA